MSWRRGQAYGQDLRDRVLAVAGDPIRVVAARFGVSPSWAKLFHSTAWLTAVPCSRATHARSSAIVASARSATRARNAS